VEIEDVDNDGNDEDDDDVDVEDGMLVEVRRERRSRT